MRTADPAYGEGLARCFELRQVPTLSVTLRDRGVSGARATFAVTRLSCDGARAGLMREIPAQDAYLATLHLGRVRHLETWLAGRPAFARGYGPGMLQILDLRDEVATYLAGPWDALGFYLPRPLVHAVARGDGAAAVDGLACEPGIVDPVLGHLGAAAIALLSHRPSPSRMLLRRLALATCAHIVQAYGVACATGPAAPRWH